MNARCVSALLLRPATVSRPLHTIPPNPLWRRAPASRISQRCLNTTSPIQTAQRQRQPDPEPANNTTPAVPNPFADMFPMREPNEHTSTSSADTSAAMDNLINANTGSSKQKSQKQSFFSSPPSSSDELRAAYSGRQFGASWLTTPDASKGERRRTPLNFDDMNMPDDMLDTGPAIPMARDVEVVYPRLNASYGRTVDLNPSKGRDLVRGLSMLGTLVARNKIKNDFNKQKFHERPGLRRKRLNSERWRRRFKVGFNHVCARVTELTKKGW